MSLDEWASLPEDQPGELVDGQLVEEEVPDFDHESVVTWLIVLLGAWILPRRGFVFASEGKFALRPGLGRKPDISVFFPGGAVPPRHGPGRVAPDILVEVISSSARDVRRDRIDKAADYAAFGVRFYWLIDPDDRTFEIFELQAGGYLRVLAASEGALDVPGCAGLRLDLDALWAEIERLG
jgi:Uma2 family endonuclease